MINNVLISGIQQGDSVIHIHVFIFQILFPFRLLKCIEQHSLSYTVGPCWLSILNTAVVTLYFKLITSIECQSLPLLLLPLIF